MILFIDPGAHDIGWCLLDTVGLVDCGFMSFATLGELGAWLRARIYTTCVIEMPQADKRSQHSLNITNDLLDVAVTVGVCAGACADVHLVKPHTWKGSMPKAKHQKHRIMPALRRRPEGAGIEQTLAAMTKDKRVDVTDAVGLALWWIENKWKGGL